MRVTDHHPNTRKPPTHTPAPHSPQQAQASKQKAKNFASPHGRALSFHNINSRVNRRLNSLSVCVWEQMDRPPPHGRMMTTEWSFPRLNLPTAPVNKTRPWTKWTLIILAVLTIVPSHPSPFFVFVGGLVNGRWGLRRRYFV